MWDCFGGDVKPEEQMDPERALIREVYEELGISLQAGEAVKLIESDKEWVYYVHFPDWKTREIRLQEGAGYAWYFLWDAFRIQDLTEGAHEILQEFVKQKLQA